MTDFKVGDVVIVNGTIRATVESVAPPHIGIVWFDESNGLHRADVDVEVASVVLADELEGKSV